MKKILLPLFALALFVSLTNTVLAQTVTVAGAGSIGVNGTYTYSNIYGGKNTYTGPGGSYTLYWEPAYTPAAWKIAYSNGQGIYLNTADTPTPPATGWQVDNTYFAGGSLPDPTLSGDGLVAPAGSGTSVDPYLIATLSDLYWMTITNSAWGSIFKQTADIDASSTSNWAAGAGFAPIGNFSTTFTGLYDGQGYKITGLFINRSTKYNGLFGFVSGGTIKNVKLESVNITGGDNYAGGLIGYLYISSNATNCCSTGNVSGTFYVGGLIGYQDASSATNGCYSSGSVTGSEGLVGGLMGGSGSTSTTKNCYSTATVTGTNGAFSLGGLMGAENSSADTNCYSTGVVTGTSGSFNIGGLIGAQVSSSALNCFWDMISSGQSTSALGTGESTTLMKTQSTFTDAGWNFTSVWEMTGTNYPRLKAIPDPNLPVELTSFTASVSNLTTVLAWKTATEVNNEGFEIERQGPHPTLPLSGGGQGRGWGWVGSVAGAGTSNTPHNYFFTDNVGTAGTYSYRLKQIDHNGAFTYSQAVQVQVGAAPKVFALAQNYPNPFNPTTTMQFTVPNDGRATLKVYNTLGQKVATLFDGVASAGEYYQATFDGSRFASGIYFARLEFGGQSLVKKLLMTK